MSTLNVDKVDPSTGTDLELGTSGDTVTVPSGVGLTLTDSTLLLPTTITSTTEVKTNKISPATGVAFALGDSGDTFTVPSGATLDISASTLTPPATMPASSGINLTALNATNLGSGTVPTARLGSGTASSSVFLAGDNTWAAAGGGKVLQVVSVSEDGYSANTTSTSYIGTGLSVDITPASTSNKILIIAKMDATWGDGDDQGFLTIERDGTDLADTTTGFIMIGEVIAGGTNFGVVIPCPFFYLDSPSSTSSLTYEINIRSRYGATVYYGLDVNLNQTIVAVEIDGT